MAFLYINNIDIKLNCIFTFDSNFAINSTKLLLCHGVTPYIISYKINPIDQISHLQVYDYLLSI